jgi:uncharacterized protein
MVEPLTFLELAKLVLSETKRPLAPSEIWKIAISKRHDSRLRGKGKTPERTLYSAIFLDERDNPNSIFIKYDTRPARYYLKNLAGSTKSSELQEKAASEPAVPQSGTYKEGHYIHFFAIF